MSHTDFINICNKLSELKKSTTITLPEIFGIKDKEIYITQWLSFLLDPNRNGGWYGMIDCFLKCVNEESNYDRSDKVDVRSEYVFSNGRRIDLLIETSNQIIAIENKLWSSEQPNQTKDYASSLNEYNKENKKLICIYLKPELNGSCPEDKIFQIVTYNTLHLDMESFDVDEDNKITKLLRDEFIKYVGVDLVCEFPEMSEYIEAYYNSISIIKDAESAYKNYVDSIDEYIKKGLDKNSSDFKSDNIKAGYWQIIKRDSKWRTLDFHIEVFPECPEATCEMQKRFAFASGLHVVIHLEPNKSQYEKLKEFFIDDKTNKPIEYKNTITLVDRTIDKCVFSSIDGINKALDKLSKELKKDDFTKWYKCADKAIQELNL